MEDDRADLLDAGLSLSLNHCGYPSIAGAAHRPLPTPSSTAPSMEPSLSLALPGDDDDCASAGKAARTDGGSKVGEYSGGQSSPSPSLSSSFWKIKKEDDGRCHDDDDRVGKVSSSRVSADEEEEIVDGGGTARKKLRLTKEQSALLEDRFKEHTTLNPKQKQGLAKQLKLRPRQVEVWFQNRRARTKLKKTEAELEILRKCCETLTEENSRLQKELQELKYLPHKLSAAGPRYLQLLPAATALRMCPSCKKAVGGGDDGASGGGAGRMRAAAPGKSHFFNPFAHSAAC